MNTYSIRCYGESKKIIFHYHQIPTLSLSVSLTCVSYMVTRRVFGDNYVPHRRGGRHIVFGVDPVGVGVSIGVSVTLSCLHDIS